MTNQLKGDKRFLLTVHKRYLCPLKDVKVKFILIIVFFRELNDRQIAPFLSTIK